MIVEEFIGEAGLIAEPLDNLGLANERLSAAGLGPAIYKSTLPTSDVSKLLWLTAKEGIDSAGLFPTYHGVVRSMRERANWIDPFRNERQGHTQLSPKYQRRDSAAEQFQMKAPDFPAVGVTINLKAALS